MTLKDLDKAVTALTNLGYHVERRHGPNHESLAIIALATRIAETEANAMRDAAISRLPGNTSKVPLGWSAQAANT